MRWAANPYRPALETLSSEASRTGGSAGYRIAEKPANGSGDERSIFALLSAFLAVSWISSLLCETFVMERIEVGNANSNRRAAG